MKRRNAVGRVSSYLWFINCMLPVSVNINMWQPLSVHSVCPAEPLSLIPDVRLVCFSRQQKHNRRLNGWVGKYKNILNCIVTGFRRVSYFVYALGIATFVTGCAGHFKRLIYTFTHTMPCPCRGAKGLHYGVPIWFTQDERVCELALTLLPQRP